MIMSDVTDNNARIQINMEFLPQNIHRAVISILECLDSLNQSYLH